MSAAGRDVFYQLLCRVVDEGEVVSIPPGTVHLALAKHFCIRSRKMDAGLSNSGELEPCILLGSQAPVGPELWR